MDGRAASVDRPFAPPGARVLVSGASFAGLATAYWMRELGYEVTIVEVAGGIRKGGTPVDIKEGTIDIVRRMGLLDAIRAASLPPRRTEIKDADDVTLAAMPARPVVPDGPDEEYEIDRGALLDIMLGAVTANIVFGRSILRLEDGADGITAWFDDGSSQRYALVLGCDGARSNTRRLVFGDESCVLFLENYTYLEVVPKALVAPNVTQIFSVPGRTMMVNGYDAKTDIAFSFRSEHEIAYNHRDKAGQRRMVRERFAGLGWRTAALLEAIDGEGDFYFDRICQIRMPAWSKGRVALVGDAGYCPSPFAGMGGSMALVGAAALADAFARHGGDVTAAFAEYDASLRPFVEAVQEEAVSFGRAMFAPATEVEIEARDRMLVEM